MPDPVGRMLKVFVCCGDDGGARLSPYRNAPGTGNAHSMFSWKKEEHSKHVHTQKGAGEGSRKPRAVMRGSLGGGRGADGKVWPGMALFSQCSWIYQISH